MPILILSTLLTSFMLYLMKDTFSLGYFWIGVITIFVTFLQQYNVHIRGNFKHISQFAHWKEWEHLWIHAKNILLAYILYIVALVNMLYVKNPVGESLILLIFLFGLFTYYLGIAHGLKTLYKYEEKHLHLFSVVKLLTVFLSIHAVIQLVSVDLSYREIAAVSIGVLYIFFLYQFKFQLNITYKKYEHLFLFSIGLLAAIVLFILTNGIYSVLFTTAILFAFYYFSWGVFKHYLLEDLDKRIVLQYFIVAIILMAIIGLSGPLWEVAA